MPILPAHRLPRKFRRTVTREMRHFVERRRRHQYGYVWERWRRLCLRVCASMQRMRMRVVRVLCFGALLLLLFGVGMILFSSIFTVREIRVIREDLRTDVERVQKTLAPLFGKHLFFVAPGQVQILLKKAFADVDESTVMKRYPSRLDVRIHLRPLSARLLIEDSASPSDEGSGQVVGDYLTENGLYVTYAPAQIPESDKLLPIRVVDWGVRPQPGEYLLDPLLVERMREAQHILIEQFGYTVRGRVVYVRAQEFHILTDKYELWFDMRSSLDDHIHRYRLFLKAMGGDIPRKYVDLRLTDRVVYL